MSFFRKEKTFKLSDIDAGHHRVTYKGVPAIKCPFDYVLYQMLVTGIKPDLIIEIGTRHGGSALYLADLMNLNGYGEVHTIDLPDNQESELLHTHERVHIFKNGFQHYDCSVIARFQKVMIIEDGSHQYEDTLAALSLFAPYVSIGSYFIVEDGIITELGKSAAFNGGPQRAIDTFLQTNTNFITDRNYCDFFGPSATFNVNGYLKRIS
jgi:cephalosporin hydroxylase